MQDGDATRGPSRVSTRLVAVALALIVTATLDPLALQPAEAASLGRSIAAMRHGQQRAEARMRGADKRIAQMKRYRRSGDRAIRVAVRRLERARDRFMAARGRVGSASDRLRAARLELDRATHVRPNPSGAQVARTSGPRREVRSTKSELRRLRRRADRMDDRRDRARREKRQLLRAMGRSGRGIGDVVRRREQAESILGYRIAAMIDLAGRKASARSLSDPSRTGFSRPARGQTTQRFGCTGYRREPRHGRCRHFHDGIDIAGRAGSRIRSAAPGVVAYSGWNPWDLERRAYIVIVAHRAGLQTVYGHLRPVRKVRAGKTVRRGQVIGLMGSTGNSTGPHLHWEVRKGATALDPRRFR